MYRRSQSLSTCCGASQDKTRHCKTCKSCVPIMTNHCYECNKCVYVLFSHCDVCKECKLKVNCNHSDKEHNNDYFDYYY